MTAALKNGIKGSIWTFFKQQQAIADRLASKIVTAKVIGSTIR
ncbi:hypothetical protein [Oenococcus sp.]